MKRFLLILLITGCTKAKVTESVVIDALPSTPVKQKIIQKPLTKPDVYESLSSRFRKTEL